MKCQKGKTCVKQQSGSINSVLSKNGEPCTGCDGELKDKKPTKGKTPKTRPRCLTKKEVETNIRILGWMKEDIFKGDHPGIDNIVTEMESMLKNRKKDG